MYPIRISAAIALFVMSLAPNPGDAHARMGPMIPSDRVDSHELAVSLAMPQPEAFAGGMAAVNADGTLARGVGVAKTTNFLTGGYHVKFKGNIRDCYYFTTNAAATDAQAIVGTNIVSARPNASNARILDVYIWNTFGDGNSSNAAFMVDVRC
jgi:hypothetical protein